MICFAYSIDRTETLAAGAFLAGDGSPSVASRRLPNGEHPRPTEYNKTARCAMNTAGDTLLLTTADYTSSFAAVRRFLVMYLIRKRVPIIMAMEIGRTIIQFWTKPAMM